MVAQLPPGPRVPAAIQTLGWWARPLPYFERLRARYGPRFTMRIAATPPFVHITDPDEVREVFQADPAVLHPGEGAAILEPIVGAHSLILLDEAPHLAQRRLLLPAFHGERMQALAGVMREVTEAAVDRWPSGAPEALHPRLQDLTLEIILRAVFGLDEGEQLDALRSRLARLLELGAGPSGMIPQLQRRWNPGWRVFSALRDDIDARLFALIEERRADRADRDDILSMLLGARHEDGTPMSDQELRDELVTLLVAGHETTASELAWGFVRLAGDPRVTAELTREVDAGDGDTYLKATINEILRARPVLPNAEPRLVKEEVEIGGWRYPVGCCLAVNAYLVHHDPAIYPDPYAFRPERFVGVKPGTYTFLPFGGGRRRCIGASFALLEMEIVLRAVLERRELVPGTGEVGHTRRRNITVSPRQGARVALRERVREPVLA